MIEYNKEIQAALDRSAGALRGAEVCRQHGRLRLAALCVEAADLNHRVARSLTMARDATNPVEVLAAMLDVRELTAKADALNEAIESEMGAAR